MACFRLALGLGLCGSVMRGAVLAQAGSPNDVLNAPPPAPELTELDERKPPDAAAAPAKPTADASKNAPAAARRAEAAPANTAAAGGGGRGAPSDPPPRARTPAGGPSSGAAAAGGAAAPINPAAGAAPRAPAAAPAAGRAAEPPPGSANVRRSPAHGSGPVSNGARSGAASKGGSPSTDDAGRIPAADSGAASGPQPSASGSADALPPMEEASADVPPPPSVDGDFAGTGAGSSAAVATATQDDFVVDAQETPRRKKREYSVRIDLLNWLLLGRLSIELEAAVWKFLSVSLTPVFVLAKSPIAINYAGVDDPVTQHSNGIGPLSGASVGVGAWLWGEPFKGYVIRLELTNYGYSYRSQDAQGRIDRVDFTERRALLFIGSHSRFGAFTFAGGFGLGYELNQQTRCGLSTGSGDALQSRTNDCRGRQQIALDRGVQERMDLNGPLHPVYFQARFSVGVVF